MSVTELYVWTILGLLLLNIGQAFFWSLQVARLVDKLMSRNYAEYVQAEHLYRSSPVEQTQKHFSAHDGHDPILNELNSII